MQRLISKKDFKYYTMLKKILLDLGLADKEYWWLISDIEAYPRRKEYQELLNQKDHLLISTSDLVKMLEADDFQWIWAVFSVIPFEYSKDDILKYELPYLQDVEDGKYNPYDDEPKLQHPLAKFEIYAFDSSFLFLVSDDERLLSQFKKCYPRCTEKF